MRIVIASRIFAPEPSAASVRLSALAGAMVDAGHEVTVLTVKPNAGTSTGDEQRPFLVKRAPVLRDSAGYVRGYLQYMSFDIPLFFRILFSRKADLIVVEPPPTTGFFVRLAGVLRRTPYAYYAADIWSDAASQTGAGRAVLRVLRAVEMWALGGAETILAVSEGVESRLRQLGIQNEIVQIGNGVDTTAYGADGPSTTFNGATILYAGTASEWHGAEILVDAFALLADRFPDARLLFVGGGSERERLQSRAVSNQVEDRVGFLPVVTPTELARHLRGAAVSVATSRPGAGYDFAFPTKLYSSAACGTPMVFAGLGPAQAFVRTLVDGSPIGIGVDWAAEGLAGAIAQLLSDPPATERRTKVAAWAAKEVSISAPAGRAVDAITKCSKRNDG